MSYNLTDEDREFLADLVRLYTEKAQTLHYAGIPVRDMSRDELLCLCTSLVDHYVPMIPASLRDAIEGKKA